MTQKFKEFAQKAIPVIKQKASDFFKAAKAVSKKLGKLSLSFAKKLWHSLLKALDRFSEYMEPKIIKVLQSMIKGLNKMSQDYENRRIARSKLTPKEKFIRYYPRATAVAMVICGLMFIISAYHIYLTGGDFPFTREKVGRYLIILAIPSAITVAMIIANTVLYRFTGITGDEKYEGTITASFRLSARINRLRTQFDSEHAPKAITKRIEHHRARERKAFIVTITITVVAIIASLLISLDIGRYTIENVNTDIATVAFAIIINAAITLSAWSIWSIIHAFARQEEVFAIKDAIREDHSLLLKTDKEIPYTESGKKIVARTVLRIGLIAISLVLIILGALNGGMADVLDKAVKICTECIGLG